MNLSLDYEVVIQVKREITSGIGLFLIRLFWESESQIIGEVSTWHCISSAACEKCEEFPFNQVSYPLQGFLEKKQFTFVKQEDVKEELEKKVVVKFFSTSFERYLDENEIALISKAPQFSLASVTKSVVESVDDDLKREILAKMNALKLSPQDFVNPLQNQEEEVAEYAILKKTKRSSVFKELQGDILQYLDGLIDGKKRKVLLYKHQIEALMKMKSVFASQSKATIILPTGTGKTTILVLAPYILGSSRVLVVTPNLLISKQIDKAFSKTPTLFKLKIMLENEEGNSYIPATGLVTTSSEIRERLNSDLMIVNAHKLKRKRTNISIDDLPKDKYDLIIVDEAHHYPSDTWKNLVDHFSEAKILFLTATGTDRTKLLIPDQLNVELERNYYVEAGIIRPLVFRELKDDLSGMDEEKESNAFKLISEEIKKTLLEHDELDPSVKHQAMVLVQSVELAKQFEDLYNLDGSVAHKYTNLEKLTVLENFVAGTFQTMIIISKSMEGFDHSPVSVVAIARKCRSPVVFSQFTGRAIRKRGKKDPVSAVLISHKYFKQEKMYNDFDKQVSEAYVDVESDE